MTRPASRGAGFTMLELVFAVVIVAIVGIILLISAEKPARIMHNYEIRVTADAEARNCMQTILHLLRSAVPGSVAIANDDPEIPGTNTGTPNSHITFNSRPADRTFYSTYDIYLTNVKPPTQIRLKATAAPGAPPFAARVLASNAAYLTFNTDVRDQTLLDVSLRLSVPMNSNTSQTHDVEILNQQVRVGSAP